MLVVCGNIACDGTFYVRALLQQFIRQSHHRSTMPKERTVNPAQAQRKADKQKEIAKSRKQQQSQRNEKLARRNPERLQRQIDELKELEGRNALRPKDKETLSQLERDLKGIRRAREALGDAAPKFASHGQKDGRDNGARQEQMERRQQLGKRSRDNGHDDGESDTDPEVRGIPMPRDTPPPIPRQPFRDPQIGPDGQRVPHGLPAKPVAAAPAQTVYSSAPQLRDLKKEAVRFMPSVVAQQKNRVKGQGRLLEPEEVDRLEKAGYMDAKNASEEASRESRHAQIAANLEAQGEDADLDEEMRKFENELGDIYSGPGERTAKGVQMEEVEDEDL
nr:protein saf1 [Quercus suber]